MSYFEILFLPVVSGRCRQRYPVPSVRKQADAAAVPLRLAAVLPLRTCPVGTRVFDAPSAAFIPANLVRMVVQAPDVRSRLIVLDGQHREHCSIDLEIPHAITVLFAIWY